MSEGEGWARKLSQACAHVCVCMGAGLRAGGWRLLPYEGCRRSQPRRVRAAAEPQLLSIRGSRAMRYAGLGCGRSLRDRRSGERREPIMQWKAAGCSHPRSGSAAAGVRSSWAIRPDKKQTRVR